MQLPGCMHTTVLITRASERASKRGREKASIMDCDFDTESLSPSRARSLSFSSLSLRPQCSLVGARERQEVCARVYNAARNWRFEETRVHAQRAAHIEVMWRRSESSACCVLALESA